MFGFCKRFTFTIDKAVHRAFLEAATKIILDDRKDLVFDVMPQGDDVVLKGVCKENANCDCSFTLTQEPGQWPTRKKAPAKKKAAPKRKR